MKNHSEVSSLPVEPIKKKRKIAKYIILGLLLLVLISALIFSYWIGKQVAFGLLYTNEGTSTKQNSIDQLIAWGYDQDTFEAIYPSEAFVLTAEDGNSIPVKAFYSDNDADKNTVILVHGLGGDHVSIYPIAQLYLENNWNVLALDQRGSEDSASQIVTFGYLEQRDIKVLTEYARGMTTEKKIAVHGVSMGAATAGLYASTDHAAAYLDYAILDSSYDSMENMFLGFWRSMNAGDSLESYVLKCGDLYLKLHYGFGFEDVDIVSAQKTNFTPTLVIQGTQDILCTPDMGQKIFDRIASPNKQLWYVESAHIEAVIDHPAEYARQVMDFLN